MICRTCNNPIELERLEILPKTCACSSCAQKLNLGGSGRKGRMIYTGKDTAEIQIISADFYEKTKAYFEPQGARSVVKNFSKSICV